MTWGVKSGAVAVALFASAVCLLSVSQALASVAGETGNGEKAADARSLFAKHCASCHGRDGRSRTFKGRLNHARNLTDAGWQNQVSDERLFNSINNGRGKKMPRFEKKLSENQIDELVPTSGS